MNDGERPAEDRFETWLRRGLDGAADDAPRVDVDALLEAAEAPVGPDVRREDGARHGRGLPVLAAAAAAVAVVGVGGVSLVTGGEPARTPGASSPSSGATDSSGLEPTGPSTPSTGVLPPALCADSLRVGGRTYVATDRTPPPDPDPVGGTSTGVVERCSTDPADPEPDRSRVRVVPVDATSVVADGTTWALYDG